MDDCGSDGQGAGRYGERGPGVSGPERDAARLALAADLEAAAREELIQACDLGWRALLACTPWGDTFEGFSPQGRPVCFERAYMWEDRPGGDIRVEVTVFEPQAFEAGVRLVHTLRRED